MILLYGNLNDVSSIPVFVSEAIWYRGLDREPGGVKWGESTTVNQRGANGSQRSNN
jgi:hypothetical protein